MHGPRRWFRWGAALTLGILAAAVAPAAALAATSSEVPDDVTEWFRTEGVLLGEEHEEWAEADLRVGAPRPVGAWTPEYLAGADTTAPVTSGEEWIAVLTRADEDAFLPVGTVRVVMGDGEPREAAAAADLGLAQALADLDPSLLAVYDPDLDGWFAMGEAKVWPLTEGARELLVGPVPITTLQLFLTGAQADDGDARDGAEAPPLGGNPTLLGMVLVAALGAGAVAIVVRQLRRSDERIAREMRDGQVSTSG